METNSNVPTQDVINQRFSKMIEFLVPNRVRSKSKLAEMLGTSQVQLNAISLGTKGRNATIEMISRALQIFPDFNPSWMLGHTDGPIFLEGNASSFGQAIVQEYADLPFVKVSMRASFTESIIAQTVPEVDTIRVMYVHPKIFSKGVVFEVDGDSMEPNYVPGARVLALPVDPSNWQYINSGVYAICFGSSFVIKRVRDNHILTDGHLTLHSDNPSGGSLSVRMADIQSVWKIEQIVYSPAR